MAQVSVCYIVTDVAAAITFYTEMLGFKVDMHPAPGFAMLSRDGLRLLLNQPAAGGGGQAVAGLSQAPGGWNRFQIEVTDLTEMAKRLRDAGCHFRGEIIVGRGGNQLLVEDPSGNAVELFEPAAQA